MSEYAAAIDEECKCNYCRINLCDVKNVKMDLTEHLEITKENIARAKDKKLKLESNIDKHVADISGKIEKTDVVKQEHKRDEKT